MTSLERHAQAAVDDAPVERGPRIDGPAAVAPCSRQDERVVLCLPDIEQVFGIDEEPGRRIAALPARLRADVIGSHGDRGFVDIRPADQVHLDTESSPLVAFPDRIRRPRMGGRQRHGTTHLFVGVELGGSGPRVRRERDKTFTTVSQQQLYSRSACAFRGVEKLDVAGVEDFSSRLVEGQRIRIRSR